MTTRSFGSGSGKRQRHLAVERLESRSMLAGNVNGFVDGGGNLIVRGDNNANLVLIQEVEDGNANDNRHSYVVTGFDFADSDLEGFAGGPTNITGGVAVEGEFEGSRLFANVRGDINIDLKKGNDGLGLGNTLEDLAILAEECGFGFAFGSGSANGPGSFPAQVGPEIDGGRFLVPRNLIVNTSDGNDGVVIIADVKRSAIINTGNGNDVLGIGNSIPDHEERSVIGDDLIVTTGNGNDGVCIHGLLVKDQVVVVTGNGNDAAELFSFSAKGVVIDTGAGNDGTPNDSSPITVEDAAIRNQLTIVTGSGNDLVEVEDVSAGSIFIDTGSGNDGTVDFEGPVNDDGVGGFPIAVYNVNVRNNLTVLTGSGNDVVYIYTGNGGEEEEPTFSNIGGSLILNTGEGNDLAAVVDQIIGRDLNVILGGGNDAAAIGSFDNLPTDTQLGVTQGTLDVGRTVVVDAGAGNDLVGLGNIEIGLDLLIFLSIGNDSLFVQNATVGRNAIIDASTGNDSVSLNDAHADKGTTTILMGPGNDTLNIFSSTGKKLRVFGGAGNDDTFNNDLGIDSNGSFDTNGDGKNDAEVREFENFNEIEEDEED